MAAPSAARASSQQRSPKEALIQHLNKVIDYTSTYSISDTARHFGKRVRVSEKKTTGGTTSLRIADEKENSAGAGGAAAIAPLEKKVWLRGATPSPGYGTACKRL